MLLDIDFNCEKCGNVLTALDRTVTAQVRIEIVPCDRCLDEADCEGYDRGLLMGRSE